MPGVINNRGLTIVHLDVFFLFLFFTIERREKVKKKCKGLHKKEAREEQAAGRRGGESCREEMLNMERGVYAV